MGVRLSPDVMLGEMTSGTFSPTLRKGVGFALVSIFATPTPRSASTSAVAGRSSS